jgi:hypothetical protein
MFMDLITLCERCEIYYCIASKRFQLDKIKLNGMRRVADRLNYMNELKLTKLGSGSGRAVYLVNSNKVIKLATNVRGIYQNRAEFDNLKKVGSNSIAPNFDDMAPDFSWIEMEYVDVFNNLEDLGREFGFSAIEFWKILRYGNEGSEVLRINISNNNKRLENETDINVISELKYLNDIFSRALSNQRLMNILSKIIQLGLNVHEFQFANHWGKTRGANKRIVLTDLGFSRFVRDVYNESKLTDKDTTAPGDGEEVEEEVAGEGIERFKNFKYEYDTKLDVKEDDPEFVQRLEGYKSRDPKNVIPI